MAGKEVVKKDTGEIVRHDTGLDISPDGELQVAASTATAIQEIQAAVFLARRFPRDYDNAWQKLQKACMRKTLAEVARYMYPRGGSTISGPSVYLARVAAQCYGNLRWGLDILRNDQDSVLIQGWAWDIENNTKVPLQDSFEKLIYRKGKDGKGYWIKPDERDLRELINRRGAILIRNCLFNILPRDYIEDAIACSVRTLKADMKDPDSEKKRLIVEFLNLGITVGMVNEYIGHANWTKDEIVDLKAILYTIKQGAASAADYFNIKQEEVAEGGLNLKDMKAGDVANHQSIAKKKSTEKK